MSRRPRRNHSASFKAKVAIAGEQWDVLIRGGRVVDGTGNPWFRGDVALTGDRVAAVLPPGVASPAQAAETVDATGMVVAPGFIDIQSHSIEPFRSACDDQPLPRNGEPSTLIILCRSVRASEIQIASRGAEHTST